MRLSIDVRLDYGFTGIPDVLLQIEAAAMHDQRIEHERLIVWSDHAIRAATGEDGIGQRCWARGDGRLVIDYAAVVTVERPPVSLASYAATPPRLLPGELTAYLMPSRYSQSDRLEGFVQREFAGLRGGGLATALAAWVRAEIDYRPNTSSGDTTALDTFASRSGVCRDYAHLLVALARAASIPARCVSAYAPGVDPPDFHAVVELWLEGAWRLVDPTGMASCQDIARVCVGRDATDIAFMTVFGQAWLIGQDVAVTRLPDMPSAMPDDDGRNAIRNCSFLSRNCSQERAMTDIDERALDSLSVAPADDDRSESGRSDAGQDKSIAKRLQKNPDSPDARLDNALDESMDASDPPAATGPSSSRAPAPSSGYDEEAERKLKEDND